MNPHFTHNFSSASIKHMIEAEFYEKVGKSLSTYRSSTIVTGPDFQRHIDNHRKYIGNDKITICEIDMDIFIDIYQGCKDIPKVYVVNSSIENYGSTFIDCDLTCVSNLEAIKKTLLKQIEVQTTCGTAKKAFIFSFGLRTTNGAKAEHQYLRPIFGLLGAHVTHIVSDRIDIGAKGSNQWIHKNVIAGTKGRIKDYICYRYNAGGGPMLTCLIIYK